MNVDFLGSYPNYSKIPLSTLPEISFWGRSNVGKSSLVNALCNRKQLAKVSGVPGKTQAFVQYKMDDKWLLMDLPGYGYARVSKKLKAHWTYEIPKYLKNRGNLCLLNLLVDASIPPQEIDLETMRYLGNLQVPFYIIFTKTDRCTKVELSQFRSGMQLEIAKDWEVSPPVFEVSAHTGSGKKELMDAFKNVLNELNEN